MGSLPRLEMKDRLRYRKGSTNESQNCRACKNRVTGHPAGRIENGESVFEDRCRLFGLKGGRRYRIREDYTCDAQVMSDAYGQRIEQMMRGFGHRSDQGGDNGENNRNAQDQA
jgi:hypothetical protein